MIDDEYKLQRKLSNNLYLIYHFNSIKKLIGKSDSIRVYKANEAYKANYNGRALNLTERPSINEENHIYLWGSKPNTIDFLFSETFQKNGNSQRIIVSSTNQSVANQRIKIENYNNGVKFGKYKELDLEGKIRVLGNYTLKDFEALLKVLESLKGKFILSSYPSEILTEFTKRNNWHTKSIEQLVSANQTKSKNNKTKTLVK